MKENLPIKVVGVVEIKDADTNEVILKQKNAIHPQNVARILARGLAHEDNSWIHKMKLGNGGTNINAALQIEYLPPITTGVSADLYNPTYEEIIDDANSQNPIDNSVISYASPAPDITSIVVCKLKLDATEPASQVTNSTNPDGTFTFDELGLFTSDPTPLMLTHLIFSPVEKSAQRSILITYSLTVQAA